QVVAGQALANEGDAVALGLLQAAAVLGRDDGDLLGLDVDVAEDQRQHALADRAEAEHDHAAGEVNVLLVPLLLGLLGHISPLLSSLEWSINGNGAFLKAPLLGSPRSYWIRCRSP